MSVAARPRSKASMETAVPTLLVHGRVSCVQLPDERGIALFTASTALRLVAVLLAQDAPTDRGYECSFASRDRRWTFAVRAGRGFVIQMVRVMRRSRRIGVLLVVIECSRPLQHLWRLQQAALSSREAIRGIRKDVVGKRATSTRQCRSDNFRLCLGQLERTAVRQHVLNAESSAMLSCRTTTGEPIT